VRWLLRTVPARLSGYDCKKQEDAPFVAVDPSLLEWSEYWYPPSWKGVLTGGVITAIGACLTIPSLLLQWRTTTIREQQSDWRTSILEADTARAKAELALAQADIAKANAEVANANKRALEIQHLLDEEIKKNACPILSPSLPARLAAGAALTYGQISVGKKRPVARRLTSLAK
jgi:hypothetical protein